MSRTSLFTQEYNFYSSHDLRENAKAFMDKYPEYRVDIDVRNDNTENQYWGISIVNTKTGVKGAVEIEQRPVRTGFITYRICDVTEAHIIYGIAGILVYDDPVNECCNSIEDVMDSFGDSDDTETDS